jgi:hypothetical protein
MEVQIDQLRGGAGSQLREGADRLAAERCRSISRSKSGSRTRRWASAEARGEMMLCFFS